MKCSAQVGKLPHQSPDDSTAAVIDMLELPQRDSPLQIAVCPGTGNLLVGAVNLLIVYKFAASRYDADQDNSANN